MECPLRTKETKRGLLHRCREAPLGELSRLSNKSQKEEKATAAKVKEEVNEEGRKRQIATIVVATTSYGIAESGRRLKQTTLLRKLEAWPSSSILTGDQDGSPGYVKMGDGEGLLRKNVE